MIQVLRRVKDKNGAILYFDCIEDGIAVKYKLDDLIGLQNYLVNAYVRVSNIVAKSGCNIETIVNYSYNITPYNKPVMVNPVKISDYWGSGMTSACRYIRQCAQCDNIIIETESHKSNNRSNLLLMSIVNCGLNVKQFIRQYLSNIHPYELMVFGGSNSNIQADKTKLWVRNICYNSYIVIKLHNISTRSPIVISFHESNPNEKSRGRVDIDFDSKPCLVVIDKLSHSYDSFYSVEFTKSRGLMEYKVVDETEYYNDTMALVSYSSINKAISNTMKSRFRNIMQTYSDVSTKELMDMKTC